jgi:hypothetical protein
MKTATILLGLFSAAFSMPALREEINANAIMIITDPTDCLKEHCPNEYQSCLNDSKCIPAIQSCEDQCGTKTSCWQLCLAKKGNNNAIALAKCAAANNCLGQSVNQEMTTALAVISDPIDCVKEKCPKEYAAC